MSSDEGEQGQDRISLEDLYGPAISRLISSLGGTKKTINPVSGEIEQSYQCGYECLGCLRDLKKLYRKDDTDDTRSIARVMARCRLLESHLIPILHLSADGQGGVANIPTGLGMAERIALAATELISALTWPISPLDELREMHESGVSVHGMDYSSLMAAQDGYKLALLRAGTTRDLLTLLLPRFGKARLDRTAKDGQVINLILHTFRNMLSIRSTAEVQSELICLFGQEAVFDLLLTLASGSNGSEHGPFNVLVAEILYLSFRGVVPADLKRAINYFTPQGKQEADQKLSSLLSKEKDVKLQSARAGPSRHSRFGTTMAVQKNGTKVIFHKQSALTGKAEPGLGEVDGRKKKVHERAKVLDHESLRVNLSRDALVILHGMASSFIDSCFNTFFEVLLKDIRHERAKVREGDRHRFLSLVGFMLEFFLLCIESDKKAGIERGSDEGKDYGLVAEMIDTAAISFISSRMKTSLDDSPPLWKELESAIRCFTYQLLIIESMAATKDEEYVETASILQNQIYYNGDMIELAVEVMNKFDKQSISYLECVIHLSYVLLRMLEAYSKTKEHMVIRKRRASRARRRKLKSGVEEASINQDVDADADNIREQVSHTEHTFQFQKYEQSFANEHVLNTCLCFLTRYQEFAGTDKLKWVVKLLHRLAVKCKAEGLFFKISVLQLLQNIHQQVCQGGSNNYFLELENMILFVTRQFLKASKSNPMLYVEAFFPKSHGRWRDYSSFDPSVKSIRNGEVLKVTVPREVEVVGEYSWSEKLGIAMACLTEAGEINLIDWVKTILERVASNRFSTIRDIDGPPPPPEIDDDGELIIKAGGPSQQALDAIETYSIPCDSAQQDAATNNPHLKLMFRLLDFHLLNSPDVDNPFQAQQLVYHWEVPSSITPAKLESDLHIINSILENPLDMNGRKASERLKTKKVARPRKRRLSSGDEELIKEYDSNGEEVSKSRKTRSRRQKDDIIPEYDSEGEEVVRKQRKAKPRKEAEAQKKYLSAQFVEDSEDDDEVQAAFMQKEEELRQALANQFAQNIAMPRTNKQKKTNQLQAETTNLAESEALSADDASTLPSSATVVDAAVNSADSDISADDQQDTPLGISLEVDKENIVPSAPMSKSLAMRQRLKRIVDDSDDE